MERGFSPITGTLPLLAVCVGVILGAAYVTHYSYTTLVAKAIKNGGLQPEDRLPPMMVGGATLSMGLFCFAWTSSPDMNPWPQILSGIPLGFGIQVLSLQSLSYLIDIYLTSANSAVSGTVVIRSLVGGLFPLFAIRFYQNFHVSRIESTQRHGLPMLTIWQVFWATTLLGCFALLLAPIPVVLYVYGARIRARGQFAKKP